MRLDLGVGGGLDGAGEEVIGVVSSILVFFLQFLIFLSEIS